MVNIVDGYFSLLGIPVVLLHLEQWINANQFNLTSDANQVRRLSFCDS